MNKFSATSIIAIAVGIIANSASAADLGKTAGDPTSASYEAPVSWTGFYAGGRFGGSLGILDLGFSERDDDVYEGTGSVDGFGLSGLTGGGQIGFDYARGPILLGVFGTYDWSNSSVEINGVDLNPSGSHDTLSLDLDETYSITKNSDWSVGARAGYLVSPRTLVYGLVAYTEAEFTAELTGQSDEDVTVPGVTVGGGVEFAVASNVFAGLEATHTFYDEHVETEEAPGDDRVSFDLDETKIMGTLKVKLNGGLGF